MLSYALLHRFIRVLGVAALQLQLPHVLSVCVCVWNVASKVNLPQNLQDVWLTWWHLESEAAVGFHRRNMRRNRNTAMLDTFPLCPPLTHTFSLPPSYSLSLSLSLTHSLSLFLAFCIWVIWEHLRFNCRRNAKIKEEVKTLKEICTYVCKHEQMCRLDCYLCPYIHWEERIRTNELKQGTFKYKRSPKLMEFGISKTEHKNLNFLS